MDVPTLIMERVVGVLTGYPLALQVLAVLVGSLVAAKVIELTGRWVAQSFDGTSGSIRRVVLRAIYAPLYISVFLYGVILSVRLAALPGLALIEAAVMTVIVVLWTRAAIHTGRDALEEVKDRDDRYEFAPVLKNLWSAGVVVVAALALLIVWNVDVTPLLASAGVFGVVLGFAARDAISNFVGGIALFFDDTYKLGDFIVLESGEKGTVTDIGLRSTTLLTQDQVLITVPNSALNAEQVRNESAPSFDKRVRIPVTVAYGSDIDAVEEVLLEVARDVKSVMSSPQPEVRFDSFGDSALAFELRVFIAHPLREPRAVHRVNQEVYRRFAERGIEIPFPQRDVNIRDDDTSIERERDHEGVSTRFESE